MCMQLLKGQLFYFKSRSLPKRVIKTFDFYDHPLDSDLCQLEERQILFWSLHVAASHMKGTAVLKGCVKLNMGSFWFQLRDAFEFLIQAILIWKLPFKFSLCLYCVIQSHHSFLSSCSISSHSFPVQCMHFQYCVNQLYISYINALYVWIMYKSSTSCIPNINELPNSAAKHRETKLLAKIQMSTKRNGTGNICWFWLQ